MQSQHGLSVVFDSFKQLNLLVCGLSNNNLTVCAVVALIYAAKDELEDESE